MVLGGLCMFFFFFSSRRRHTRFDCDWSSDVCSSDLGGGPLFRGSLSSAGAVPGDGAAVAGSRPFSRNAWRMRSAPRDRSASGSEIGRASWRGRGEISVVAGSLKKKKKQKIRRVSDDE